MKWREWFVDHWRAVQALAVLVALGLTVLVTIRIVRAPVGPQALESLLGERDSRARVWEILDGPDSSTMALETRCGNGKVSYIFAVLPTRTLIARIGRTSGEEPRFDLALLDSGEFKIASIPITGSQLVATKDSMDKTLNYQAKDIITLSCEEYSSVRSWNPTWRLAR